MKCWLIFEEKDGTLDPIPGQTYYDQGSGATDLLAALGDYLIDNRTVHVLEIEASLGPNNTPRARAQFLRPS